MAKKKFWVDPNRVLEHDGKRVEGGQPLELEEAVARPLLEAGILLKDEPVEEVKASLEEVNRELAAARQEIARLTEELKALKKKADKPQP